jgi:MtN3 and saliva related transmembrane protein
LIMYCVFITGLVLWLTYGILIWDLPIILANFITLILAGIILVMKLRCG